MSLCDLSTAECVVSVTGAATAIATTVAACVTAWMAVETRRMASAAKRSVDLEYTPVLGVREVKFEVGSRPADLPDGTKQEHGSLTFVRAAIELFNAGRVPLTYRVARLRVSCSGRTTDVGVYLSRGGQVLPGSSTHYWSTPVALDPPITIFPVTGRISCRIEYWRNEDLTRRELTTEIEYTLGGAAPGSPTRWLTVDEPSDA